MSVDDDKKGGKTREEEWQAAIARIKDLCARTGTDWTAPMESMPPEIQGPWLVMLDEAARTESVRDDDGTLPIRGVSSYKVARCDGLPLAAPLCHADDLEGDAGLLHSFTFEAPIVDRAIRRAVAVLEGHGHDPWSWVPFAPPACTDSICHQAANVIHLAKNLSIRLRNETPPTLTDCRDRALEIAASGAHLEAMLFSDAKAREGSAVPRRRSRGGIVKRDKNHKTVDPLIIEMAETYHAENTRNGVAPTRTAFFQEVSDRLLIEKGIRVNPRRVRKVLKEAARPDLIPPDGRSRRR